MCWTRPASVHTAACPNHVAGFLPPPPHAPAVTPRRCADNSAPLHGRPRGGPQNLRRFLRVSGGLGPEWPDTGSQRGDCVPARTTVGNAIACAVPKTDRQYAQPYV